MNIQAIDLTLTRWVQSIPRPLADIMPIATLIGLPGVMAVLGMICALVFALKHQPQTALMFGVATTSLLIPTLLKLLVHRVRPDTLYAAQINSWSFPSGHAFDAVVILGLLAYVLWGVAYGNIIVGLLVALAIIIGLSRIYLGAHYPTDVIGGWLLGTLTLWLIIRFVQS